MKKTLFTLAALGAFAGAASAQSSVTLFGVVDLNGRWLNNNGVKQYSLSQDGQTQVSSDTDGDSFNVAGSWNFGFMKLSGFYGQIKVDGDKQDNWFIGGLVPLGLWKLRASYGQVERSGTFPDNVEGQKANQFAVGAEYDLSRRTALYGAWSGINNKGGASFVVGSFNNVPGGGAAANADSQGFEFGVRHAF
jgi:predicted porin